MIHLQLKQGSAEWHRARLGIPTASQFGRILTPAKLKLSSQSAGYMCEMLAQRTTGVVDAGDDNVWMERGREMEAEAARWYAFDSGLSVSVAGFCLTDNGQVGVSPDRFAGDDGLIEIKCPSLPVHLQTVTGALDLAAKHKSQVQGQLWVTGRAWCDVVSYCPGVPPHVVRVEPDPEWVAAWGPAIIAFCTTLEIYAADLIRGGAEMLGCAMPERVLAHGTDAAAIVADLRAECASITQDYAEDDGSPEPVPPPEAGEPAWRD